MVCLEFLLRPRSQRKSVQALALWISPDEVESVHRRRIPNSSQIPRMGRLLCPSSSLRQQDGRKRDQRRTPKRNDPLNSHLEESGGNTVPGSSWPSGKTNFFTCIPFSPFLAGAPMIVTWSPGLRVLLLQPLLVRRFGLGSSPCHSMTLPLSSFTVNVSNECGLTNWSSFTV